MGSSNRLAEVDKINEDLIQKIVLRLVISAVIFVAALILSAVTFYYYYATAPIIPLLVGLAGSLPAAMMLMSWHDLRLLKLKKTQQAHYPPQSAHHQQGKG